VNTNNADDVACGSDNPSLNSVEPRLDALAAALFDVLWTADGAGQQTPAASWCRFTGQTVDAAAGRGWLNAVHPEDRARAEREWDQAIRHKIPYATEYRLRRQDGAYRHVVLRANAIAAPDGTVQGWIGGGTDISERIAAAAVRQRRTDEAELLFEAANLLGRTLDPEAIYDTLHPLVARAMDCDTLLVSSYDSETNLIRCAYAWIEGKRVHADQFPPIPLAPEGRGLQSRVIRSGTALRIADVAAEAPALRYAHYVSADGEVSREPADDPRETRSALYVPITLENRVLGVAQVMSHRPDAYDACHLRLLEILMSQVAAAARNAALYQEARAEIAERRRIEAENARLQQQNDAAALRQRMFLRDMLAGLTEGRLHLCDTASDLPVPLPPAGPPMPLVASSLQAFRGEVERVARAHEFPEIRWHDLITAAGEASMNAVVHGGGTGEGRVHAAPEPGSSGPLQIWIRDQGTGIAEEALHRATLERGYTTAGSLGHGFWMILKTCDRVYLLTGPTGTTIVLEQEPQEPDTFWLRSNGHGSAGSGSAFDIEDLLAAA
jgi:PAS domain S-box-containing protein